MLPIGSGGPGSRQTKNRRVHASRDTKTGGFTQTPAGSRLKKHNNRRVHANTGGFTLKETQQPAGSRKHRRVYACQMGTGSRRSSLLIVGYEAFAPHRLRRPRFSATKKPAGSRFKRHKNRRVHANTWQFFAPTRLSGVRKIGPPKAGEHALHLCLLDLSPLLRCPGFNPARRGGI